MIIETLRSLPALAHLSIADQRAAYDTLASQLQLAEDVRCDPVDAAGVPAEWITTPPAVNERSIYYLHGGGYVIGSINTHRLFGT
jgi:monoterpene epsilon-lactone hydrolase